jgi:uncharacterized protein
MFAEPRIVLRKAPVGLWAEFVVLFIGMPLLVALVLPPKLMFVTLGAMTLVGIVLMSRTSGFTWRHLRRGWRAVRGRVLLPFVLVTTVAAVGLVQAFLPWQFLALPEASILQWLAVMLFYPIFSALPQELIFRPLFFTRYGALFGSTNIAIAANALVFSMAHLMYWHWIVLVMTLAGGVVFAWAYAVRQSFPLAFVLHAVAGQIIFTSGLGYLFWSGGVQ